MALLRSDWRTETYGTLVSVTSSSQIAPSVGWISITDE
jgi:hypothetical protein